MKGSSQYSQTACNMQGIDKEREDVVEMVHLKAADFGHGGLTFRLGSCRFCLRNKIKSKASSTKDTCKAGIRALQNRSLQHASSPFIHTLSLSAVLFSHARSFLQPSNPINSIFFNVHRTENSWRMKRKKRLRKTLLAAYLASAFTFSVRAGTTLKRSSTRP